MILQGSGHPDADPVLETLRFPKGDVTSAREHAGVDHEMFSPGCDAF
jgi:hypothetical protein